MGGAWLQIPWQRVFFVNTFHNTGDATQPLLLSQAAPGEIRCKTLDNECFMLQSGAYIASGDGVKLSLAWAGLASWLAKEGLFCLKATGSGQLFYGAYGAVIEKEIQGEYVVDSGHLLAYPAGMKLKLRLAGGVFSSLFSGEGLVLKVVGTGKIQLQTRSMPSLVHWLNEKLIGRFSWLQMICQKLIYGLFPLLLKSLFKRFR